MRKLLFISIICVTLSACASHYGAATINSNPSGAEVINIEDGTVLGVTPFTTWWKGPNGNRQHIAVRFKKEGYYEKVETFWLSMRQNSADSALEEPSFVEVNLLTK